ncbi:unnamed protein product [Aphis gossypii]|uniref:Uncharacterized protein n=1 Tax=Aphis gossypii TaxID=80765 RepID=A0A9P0J975_APHGO|nr:unnamed protein product [Aphis gossypii]
MSFVTELRVVGILIKGFGDNSKSLFVQEHTKLLFFKCFNIQIYTVRSYQRRYTNMIQQGYLALNHRLCFSVPIKWLFHVSDSRVGVLFKGRPGNLKERAGTVVPSVLTQKKPRRVNSEKLSLVFTNHSC